MLNSRWLEIRAILGGMKMNSLTGTFRTLGIPLILIVIAVLLIAGLVAFSGGLVEWPEFGLPLLAVAGVVILLAILTVMVLIYKQLGLEDRNQALGLPEGTVRAIIALMLIVIFVITAVFLYFNLSDSPGVVLEGLTESQVDAIPGNELIGREVELDDEGQPTDRFTVTVFKENRASEDFAKQLLTMLSTLVVSISSFYFGSRAVAEAGTTASVTAVEDITPSSTTPPQTDMTITVRGSNFQQVQTVKLVRGNEEIIAKSFLGSENELWSKFDIDAARTKGKWDLVITNRNGTMVRRPEFFEIK